MSKIDDMAALAAEDLARRADRKQFITRACGAVFGAIAGGLLLQPRAFGHTNDPTKGHCYFRRTSTSCEPPNSQFCSGCLGHQCPNGYQWVTHWYPNTACWCTASSGGHYKVCCDCVKIGKPWTDPSACGCYSVI
jgi:hypothetical protein